MQREMKRLPKGDEKCASRKMTQNEMEGEVQHERDSDDRIRRVLRACTEIERFTEGLKKSLL